MCAQLESWNYETRQSLANSGVESSSFVILVMYRVVELLYFR